MLPHRRRGRFASVLLFMYVKFAPRSRRLTEFHGVQSFIFWDFIFRLCGISKYEEFHDTCSLKVQYSKWSLTLRTQMDWADHWNFPFGDGYESKTQYTGRIQLGKRFIRLKLVE
jgi:hypothetical protein